jgi:superoxide dismutase, Fe-Mn family
MLQESIMNPLSRRNFLFASSGAVAGTLAVSGLLDAAHAGVIDFSKSGLVTGQPKALKHKEIPGFLSAAQIAPHHTAHYGGALKAVVAADANLEESTKSGMAQDPAAFAHLKRLVNSRGNSVVLHEFYFDGLAPKAVDLDRTSAPVFVEHVVDVPRAVIRGNYMVTDGDAMNVWITQTIEHLTREA